MQVSLTDIFNIHWILYMADSKREIQEDLGSVTAEDITYEIAIVMNVISGCAEEVDGEFLMPDYCRQIRTYLHRIVAMVDVAYGRKHPDVKRLWHHLFLSDCYVLLNNTTEAICHLDQAAQLMEHICPVPNAAFHTAITLCFMVRKFKKRLTLESHFKAARIFELNGIVSALLALIRLPELPPTCQSPLRSLTAKLFEAEHVHELPPPQTLTELEVVLAGAVTT